MLPEQPYPSEAPIFSVALVQAVMATCQRELFAVGH